MTYPKQILLGQIIRIHPYKGTVTVKLVKNISDGIPEMEFVFLEIEGKLVPFFISESEYSGTDILKLGFEGYESSGKMEEFNGCRVFMNSDIQYEKAESDLSELSGFRVYSQKAEFIGTVTGVVDNAGQWLLEVISETGKEILIPFHEDMIMELLADGKILKIEIVEGLLDINL